MMDDGVRPKEDPSLGELFADLTRETATLVRQEVQLARTEMSQKAGEVGKDLGFLAMGGAVAYAGFLALVAALVLLLVQAGMAGWSAALVVGVVVAGIGGWLVWRGVDALRHTDLAPQQTLETLKEDKQWARRQTV